MKRTLIKNGTLLDPTAAFARRTDLLIEDGVIVATGDDLPADGAVIDAAGRYVCPGFVDLHAHLRHPGDGEAETIESACRAAVRGGYTSIACLPDTDPPLDDEGQIEFVIRQAQRLRLARVYPVGSLTKANAGRELAEIGMMARGGALAFADASAAPPDVMRKAMLYAKRFGALVIQQPAEPTLSGGVMHAGDVSAALGLPGVPAEAETLILARDLLLNRAVGGRYHATAVTTAAGLALLKDHEGVTCDVSIAHLLLDHTACRTFDPLTKTRPPLRTAGDVAALIAGCRAGTVTALTSGHRPCRPDEKDAVFQEAADGMSTLEVVLPLAAAALIDPGHVDWLRLIDLMSTSPAHLLGLTAGRGTLAEGAVADLAIIDPAAPHRIDAATFASRGRNCPFHGRAVSARVTHTLAAGRVVYAIN